MHCMPNTHIGPVMNGSPAIQPIYAWVIKPGLIGLSITKFLRPLWGSGLHSHPDQLAFKSSEYYSNIAAEEPQKKRKCRGKFAAMFWGNGLYYKMTLVRRWWYWLPRTMRARLEQRSNLCIVLWHWFRIHSSKHSRKINMKAQMQ